MHGCIMNCKMKKLVIFDLDGTLSDTIASIKYCADAALAVCGLGPFTEKEYCHFVGDGAATLVERALAAAGDTEAVHFAQVFAAYKEIFAKHCMYQVEPYEGIRELLMELKKRGLKLAVLSNKPHAETVNVVETLFGRECFAHVQGQQEGVEKKPSPQGVFSILEALQVKSGEAVYVGDTDTDMKTGKAAGVFTVGVLWGFRERQELEEHHADAIIEKPRMLLDYIA